MLEIIAKSKSAKRERLKEKEADDEQLDALDLTFKALAEVSPSLLQFVGPSFDTQWCGVRPQAGALKHSLRTSSGHLKVAKHAERRRKNATSHAADDDDDDDFDALVRMPEPRAAKNAWCDATLAGIAARPRGPCQSRRRPLENK